MHNVHTYILCIWTDTCPVLSYAALQVVADQLKLEKEREAELELLYQEEAAKIWEKREAEWEKERRARECLMQEVNPSTFHMYVCIMYVYMIMFIP